jgi:hypothetical protein
MADKSPVVERVQELTWALLDEDINEDEISLLDTLLISDDKARERYIECVQLHCDLLAHFAEEPAKATGSRPPVLSFLAPNGAPTDTPSSHAAE